MRRNMSFNVLPSCSEDDKRFPEMFLYQNTKTSFGFLVNFKAGYFLSLLFFFPKLALYYKLYTILRYKAEWH